MPKSPIAIAAILVAVVAASGPTIAQSPSASADERAIHQINAQWIAAIRAKDAAAIANFYSEDGAILAPNAPIAEGRDAITKAWTSFLKLKNFSLTFASTKINVAAAKDIAYEIGTYELSFQSDRGPVRDNGKYVVVWKKVAGAWKAAADIFNSNGPTR
jgi:uncharacterized protein (TIGR02246 family)